MFDVDPRHGSNMDIQDVVGADGGPEAQKQQDKEEPQKGVPNDQSASPINSEEPNDIASSDDMAPIEHKREIDETIAYATKSHEESYADQIASLDVQGDTMSGEATYAVTMRPIAKNDTPTPEKAENRESPVNPVISDLGET